MKIIVKEKPNRFKILECDKKPSKRILDEYFHSNYAVKKLVERGDIEYFNEYFVKRKNNNTPQKIKSLEEFKGEGFLWTGYEWEWYNGK